MTKEFAYYPGCTSCSTGLAFEMSSQYLAKALDISLKEIPDWNCCGATAAHLINHDLSIALPARTLAISDDELPGLDIVAPCAACYGRLKNAVHYVRQSSEHQNHIEELIDRPYAAKAEVYSLLQAVYENEEIKEAISERITKTLNGLKVASYYGCLMVRPEEVCQFDDAENPQSMDELMRLVGAEPVDWAYKTECCGASMQISVPDAGKVMVERILHNARENGAEAIVTACPLCQLNVDMRQKEINKRMGENYSIPVYYFTELISMCLGATPKEVGITKHYFPATAFAERAVAAPSQDKEEAELLAESSSPGKASAESSSPKETQKEEVVAS